MPHILYMFIVNERNISLSHVWQGKVNFDAWELTGDSSSF